MKFPIGIQSFQNIRDGGFVYVDKTRQIYDLANQGKCYFLSRPRRFGKSLLVSTLRAYFEGKSELFKGLAIERLETEWKPYPVITISLNNSERGRPEMLDALFADQLAPYERKYGVTDTSGEPKYRFRRLIHAACKQEKRQVVVLIDEYDKPMLANMENGQPLDEIRDRLKGFYSVLKGEDEYLRFVLLTGVTRFSKVSVFSDLNNLEDISMLKRYTDLCGITGEELRAVFDEPVTTMAANLGMTRDECYAELARRYDGYHFAYGMPGIYNPFSILNAMKSQEMKNYWFATGTPSFLVDVMRNTGFDMTKGFTEPLSEAELSDVDTIKHSPVPVLFQSGYLTIKDYDPEFDVYTLGYPNTEVRSGFTGYLLPRFSAAGADSGSIASRLVRAVRRGDAEAVVECLRELFDKHGNCMLYQEKSQERDFRNIVYMVFSVLDLYTEAELCTAAGRLDISVQTKDYIYVIELKIDRTAEEALSQIRTHGYADRFQGDPRQLILMGVNFSTKTNSIDGWALA